MCVGSLILRRSVAVAGPMPVRDVRWLRASVGKGMAVGGKAPGSFGVEKPADVADLTAAASFLRIWAGRKGRLVPCVLVRLVCWSYGKRD